MAVDEGLVMPADDGEVRQAAEGEASTQEEASSVYGSGESQQAAQQQQILRSMSPSRCAIGGGKRWVARQMKR